MLEACLWVLALVFFIYLYITPYKCWLRNHTFKHYSTTHGMVRRKDGGRGVSPSCVITEQCAYCKKLRYQK